MKPLSLEATGYVRFPEMRIAFTEGSTALIGPNGSGKSALLRAIDLALFADGSRDLAQWVMPGMDRMTITLEFEHQGRHFRVRRGYRGGTRGTATVDLEEWVADGSSA